MIILKHSYFNRVLASPVDILQYPVAEIDDMITNREIINPDATSTVRCMLEIDTRQF